MEEESWRRNPGGGVTEGKSLRRHLEGIWEASGRHLGGIWEPFGIHLETAGGVEAEEASGGQISNYVPRSAAECKSSIKISISRRVFEGTINYDCIFTVRYGGRLFTGDVV